MTGGIDVDSDAMRTGAEEISSCGRSIREAVEASDAAMAMSENAFGPVLFFVSGYFHNTQVSTVTALRNYGDLISTVGDAVGECATSYDVCDENSAQSISTTGARGGLG